MYTNNNYTKVGICVILITILVACSFPATGSSTSNGGSSGAISGNCSNPLYPIVRGATWDYASNGSIIGDYEFTQSITDVRADGFTLTTEYSTGVSASQEWSCHNGDLSTLETGSGPAATLSSIGGITAQTDTEDIVGTTLPSTIVVGDTWTQTFTLSGEVNLPDSATGTGEGTYLSNFTAASIETVAVPAGMYEAIRIEAQITQDVNVTLEVEGEQIEVPATLGMTNSMWYVIGIGLVKVESLNDVMGEETIELIGYSIP